MKQRMIVADQDFAHWRITAAEGKARRVLVIQVHKRVAEFVCNCVQRLSTSDVTVRLDKADGMPS